MESGTVLQRAAEKSDQRTHSGPLQEQMQHTPATQQLKGGDSDTETNALEFGWGSVKNGGSFGSDAVGATFAATATRQTLDPFIQQPMLVVDGKA